MSEQMLSMPLTVKEIVALHRQTSWRAQALDACVPCLQEALAKVWRTVDGYDDLRLEQEPLVLASAAPPKEQG